jgi:hypothetical protein
VSTWRDGTFGYIPVWSRLASDYIAAALPHGFEVRRCEELRRKRPLVDDKGRDLNDPERPEHRPGRPANIWALHRFAPEATNAAYRGIPLAIGKKEDTQGWSIPTSDNGLI